ncbi:SgrR family transcriptional regulator [Paenibacillus thiaminolyticus]|uniref:SgrR family transcriptional regulator n=1 Tax=Paenibacillus thiaminolyticus TaxID=49283 RepID=UPI0021757B45|nr:SgrR family transcriptional regulator [Paenibacillus thiaminolyticus]
MRTHFYPRELEGRVRFRLDELAAVWKCSSKQAKRKLKKLDENGSCSYIPGRGRGNCSEIRFRSLFQDDLDAAISHSLLAKNMDLLMHILQLPCRSSGAVSCFARFTSCWGFRHRTQLPMCCRRL